MKFQQLAILVTIVLNTLASGKVIHASTEEPRDASSSSRGLRMLSDKETSLFAGVLYEKLADGTHERDFILKQAQPVFDENIAFTLAETEIDEEEESQLDEYTTQSNINSNDIQFRKRDANHVIRNQRHPVILVPGLGGSAILGKRSGLTNENQMRVRTLWVGLNTFHDVFSKKYPLALRYDLENDEFVNDASNLHTSVRDFGGVNGMKILDLGAFSNARIYLEDVVTALESRGYRIGQDLRGAPYDFRRIGDRKVRTQFFQDLQKLIEETYTINGNTRVHLAGHSLGGVLSMNFLNTYMADNQEWKDKYIESYMSIAAPFLGAPKALKLMLSGDNLGISMIDSQYLAQLTSSFSCMLWMMPHVHSDDQPIKARSDINNILTLNGQAFSNTEASIAEVFTHFKRDANLMTAFKRQIYPLYNMAHPKVKINCIYSYNIATELGYEYNSHLSQPVITMGEGDGTVPIESLEFCKQWGAEEEDYDVHVLEVKGASHGGILSDKRFLRYFTDVVHPRE